VLPQGEVQRILPAVKRGTSNCMWLISARGSEQLNDYKKICYNVARIIDIASEDFMEHLNAKIY
jgi:hypothetical protein